MSGTRASVPHLRAAIRELRAEVKRLQAELKELKAKRIVGEHCHCEGYPDDV